MDPFLSRILIWCQVLFENVTACFDPTANGEVQTNEEAQVHVHDLHLFVTLQLLEDTPAVLSSGTLFEEDSYTYEWAI